MWPPEGDDDRVGRDAFGQGLGPTGRTIGAGVVGAVEVRGGRRRECGGSAPAGWCHVLRLAWSRAGVTHRRDTPAAVDGAGQAGAGNVDLDAIRSTTDMFVVYAASPTVPDVWIQTPLPPTLMR